MPTGRPDWYDQVVIVGTDITIPISITGQTVTVDVNLKASEVTIDVNIVSSVTLNVNIASQSITIDVNIKSQSITLNVNITGSTVTLDVNIAGQSVDINVVLTGSTITLGVSIDAQTVTLDIKIVGQDIDLKIINATDAAGNPIPLDIDIVAQSVGNILVDIAAASIGNLPIDIAAQSIGNLKIDIAAQSLGTVDVNIVAQAVTLNVSVQGTASVSIDNASVYLNVKYEKHTGRFNAVKSEEEANVDTDLDLGDGEWGFLFHNMRGYIDVFGVYIKNTTGSNQTITVKVSIAPGMPVVYTYSITLSSTQTSYAWLYLGWIRRYWPYDTIYVRVSGPAGCYVGGVSNKWGYGGFKDDNTPTSYIPLIRVLRLAVSEGELPITGIVNTIRIPNSASTKGLIVLPVSAGGTNSSTPIEGLGNLISLHVWLPDPDLVVRIYIDDVLITSVSPNELNDMNIKKEKMGWRLLRYDAAGGNYDIDWILKLPFQKNLYIEFYNPTSNDYITIGNEPTAYIVYELLK